MEMGVLGKYVDRYMCMHLKIADIEKGLAYSSENTFRVNITNILLLHWKKKPWIFLIEQVRILSLFLLLRVVKERVTIGNTHLAESSFSIFQYSKIFSNVPYLSQSNLKFQ